MASLPTTIRKALEQGDQEAFEQAFTALSENEQQRVRAVLAALPDILPSSEASETQEPAQEREPNEQGGT